jgi:hypothetical protein
MEEDKSDDAKISTVRAGFGYNAEADSKGAGPIRRYGGAPVRLRQTREDLPRLRGDVRCCVGRAN